jgi:hypothetical protein
MSRVDFMPWATRPTSEVLGLNEVENLMTVSSRRALGLTWDGGGSVAQSLDAQPVEVSPSFVRDLSGDAVIPTGQGDRVADLTGGCWRQALVLKSVAR